jgi:hypothetical protein
MNTTFNTLEKLRLRTLLLIDGLELAQLNKIPEGFNNNIIWNVAHMIAAMQGVCYKRSGLPITVSDAYFECYKPESKPAHDVDEQELNEIKELLISSIDKLKEDYSNGLFKTYTAFTTRYGVDINNIEEAIQFLPFHEGMHMGYILALKRVLAKA